MDLLIKSFSSAINDSMPNFENMGVINVIHNF